MIRCDMRVKDRMRGIVREKIIEQKRAEQKSRESNFMKVKQLAALVYYLVLFYFI